jgi:Tc toxin complex TcA C-terminal TcB-binding domain/Neuraminidase-like domain/Salmonella virulence plasmid 28.1kDa A protein
MQRIIAPLQIGDRSPAVTNLQDALQLFLDRGLLLANDAGARQELAAVFPRERAEQTYSEATRKLVAIFQETQPLEPRLEPSGNVDERTADAMNRLLQQLGALEESERFVVHGILRLSDNTSVAGATIQTFDRDLRSRELLGQTTTNADGHYEIFYTREQFNRAEKQTADLIVAAVEPTPGAVSQYRTLAESPTLFNAPPEAVIDLVIDADTIPIPSEYERLIANLRPLIGDVAIADLKEDEQGNGAEGTFQDITFLAGETGFNPDHIAFLVVAEKFKNKTDLDSAIFYGLFRQNLPTDLSALLSQSQDIQRRALENSLQANIIPSRLKPQLEQILQQLRQLIVRQAVEQPETPGKSSLGMLLSTTLADANQQTEFLTAYVNHTGEIEEFWQGLRANPTFSTRVDALQFTLQLGAFTNNHLPLVQEIQRMQQQQQISSLQDLAQFDASDWLRIINQPSGNGTIGFPPDIPGNDATEQATNYAKTMSRMVEEAFPSAFIAHRLTREEVPTQTDLRTFFSQNVLNRNPEDQFDIGTSYLEQYLTQHPNALDNTSDPETAKTQIQGMQRLYKLAPQYEEMKVLQNAGFDSAYKISRMGQNTFIQSNADALGGQDRAKIVYEKASQVHATALNLLGKYGARFNGIGMHVLPYFLPQPDEIPDWQALFGSLGLCACAHCRSVNSPAAYFVDVLHFLKDRPAKTAGTNVKDILFQRRPELGEIELTCENTNTPLPYVDLVNEVLENEVAPFAPFTSFAIPTALESDLDSHTLSAALQAAFTPALSQYATITVKESGKWWMIAEPAYTFTVRKDAGILTVTARNLQTSGTAQELRANPQYINASAYDRLRQQVYPWSLPFDFWWEQARTYLEHLGIHRYQVMETFLSGDRTTILETPAIAYEYLGISSTEAQIIVGTTTNQSGAATPGVWNMWGFGNETLDASLPNSIPNPANSTIRITTGTWSDVVTQRTDVFLQQSGLAYANLLALLDTLYLNPRTGNNRQIGIESTDLEKPDTCELQKLKLSGLDVAGLVKISRFVRLWHKLGWTIQDLDKAITALKPTDLDNAFLTKLFHIQRLQDDLGLSIPSLLSLWAEIDTTSYTDFGTDELSLQPSLYRELFRNKSVSNPLNLTFTEDAANLSGKLSEKDTVATLIAALGISADEFLLLLNDANVIPRDAVDLTKPDDTLNLDHLSRLYRHTTLAKVTQLSIRDYLSACKLIDSNPFATTTATVLFVERVDKMRSSGFSIAELDYLLRHDYTPSSDVAPTEEAIAITLDEIRSGLQKIAAENTFTADLVDPTGDLIKKKLAIVLSSPDVDKAMALLNRSWQDVPASKLFIDTHFVKFLDVTDAKAKLIDPGPSLITEQEARYRYVLEPLLNYLRQNLSEDLIKQKLGEALKLEAKTTEQLLMQWVTSPADGTKFAMAEFLADPFANSDLNIKLTAAAFANPFNTLIRLSKVAMIIDKFKVTFKQLTWLFDYGIGVGWLNLNALPLTLTSSTAAQFTAWERLVDLFQLRSNLPLGETVLTDMFALSRDGVTTQEQLLQKLNSYTQWSLENLSFLAGTQGFNFTFPNNYQDERPLMRLWSCLTLLKRLGTSAKQCRAWANSDVTEADARAAKQAAKSKYEEAQWLTLAKPLRDVLREKQRAALVAYLVTHPDPAKQQTWKDANGLYEYFLIDVEMSPCQMTSRIKQAISSTQLFVQRCLMNLEKQVAASITVDVHWQQWKWMKNYRVWEANRKVFFYPENWIEPELRDDKSPFFKELESELLQNDLTMDTAETSFLHYLEKLDAVARLEIVGMYHQEEYDKSGNKAVDILHTFGRTRGIPHIYYYRQRIDSAYWTSWEKVDVDIQGDHLIPTIWNRRLYLFWAVFSEKQEDKPVVMPKTGQAIEAGRKYWEIQIAWSEYKNGRWLPKKISSNVLKSISPFIFSKDQYFFKGVLNGGELSIYCYYSFSYATGSNPSVTLMFLVGKFNFTNCNSLLKVEALSGSPTIVIPTGCYTSKMMFVADNKSDHKLYLPTSLKQNTKTLNLTPETFYILYPHQDEQFNSQRPFFYQDDTKTFFIIPENGSVRPPIWWEPVHVTPGVIDQLRDRHYTQKTKLIPDISAAVINPTDPLINEPSFSINTPLTQISALASTEIPNGISTPITGAVRNLAITSPQAKVSALSENVTLTSRASDILRERVSTFQYLPFFQPEKRYLFQTFYHPYVCPFVRELNQNGINGLLQRPLQLVSHEFFKNDYDPQSVVNLPYPLEDVDFNYNGAYSSYNWELFFHVPLMIGDRLSKNQRFEEAQKWFHYIFDPTDVSDESVPQRYWRTKPFFKTTDEDYQNQQIQNLLRFLALGGSNETRSKLSPTERKELEQLEKQVKAWRDNPFKPHLVARLRTTAYQKTVVMKYLDNLIAWGDQLFRRDTIETLNEATQLYILAAEILGPRPEDIPPRAIPEVQTYKTLESKLDAFSNGLVKIEHFVPALPENSSVSLTTQPPLTLPMLYFCIPKNDKLLGYWDTVADRLFKIRNCMNIEGIVRQLPLFEPPIDPALLVKAAAAGIDISSALNDINAALPHYRFNVMAQKATELCSELKALGAALLSALEKRDAETLALLRSTHEIRVLNAVRQVKEKQIEEAKETLEGLKKSREVVGVRKSYYETRDFMNPWEYTHLGLTGGALLLRGSEIAALALSSGLHQIPNIKVGAPTTVGAETGGSNAGHSSDKFSASVGKVAAFLEQSGSMAATLGNYWRRKDDWAHQAQLASKELEQIDKQIAVAEIRKQVSEKELLNHDLQVENAHEMEAFMRDKFTNRELYDWMVGQISGIYFQSYQLAYDVAKRTEQTYRFELGLQDSNFIQFGYWDSLKKGLLAGEKLYHDLKRMEVAYLEQHKREYEITKHISLAMLDAVALVQLRQTGECLVSLPEALFDLDYSGHYIRRVKSVSVTIPCVTGAYTSISCTLTLIKSSIRRDNKLLGGKYIRQGDTDFRFTDNLGAIQSIVTSNAQNDSGMFEPNLRDERYLPFEGAGAISEWRIELPKEFRQFDYDTISDVILHMRYTAREAGGLLKQQASKDLQAALNAITLTENQKGLTRLFSAQHELTTEWHRFMNPASDTGDQTLKLDFSKNRFPFLFQTKNIQISKIELFVEVKKEFIATHNASSIKLSLAPGVAPSNQHLALTPWNGLLRAEKSPVGQLGTWTLTAWLDTGGGTHERLNSEAIEDLFIVCHYAVS